MSNTREAVSKDELARRWQRLQSFLKSSEVKYPDLATQLPGLLTRMLGEQTFDPNLMHQNEKFLSVGFSILGEWLGKNGFGAFDVPLSTGENGLKIAAKMMVKLPQNRDEFFQTSGILPTSWNSLNAVVFDLSNTVRDVLGCGYAPKQIVAALFYDSTTSVVTQNTSVATREQLNKLSGGRLPEVNAILARWIQNQ